MKKLISIIVCVAGISQLHGQIQYEFKIENPDKKKYILLKNFEGDLVIRPVQTDHIKVDISLYKDSKYFKKSSVPNSIKFYQETDHIILEGTSTDSNRKYVIELPNNCALKFRVDKNRDNLKIVGNQQPLEIRTQGMDIVLVDNSGPLSITTTHGDLSIAWKNARPLDDSYITTVSGEIEMIVDDSSSFNLFIDPYRGSIENVWNMQLKRGSKYKNRKTYDGVYNQGGAMIYIETSVGDIILDKNN